ncbi:UNVERIFIED_CONTAM: hypothetical protein FKN15_018612 [Acipenser sinensis]
MTMANVEGARPYEEQFHIRVYNHKTAGRYGAAVVVVTVKEHEWLSMFSTLRASLPGYQYQPRSFFFTRRGNPVQKMGRLLSKACDIGERLTPGIVRGAVATYTWAIHGEVSKSTVSRHMSHSLQNQASFYVHDESPADHRRARHLIEQSLDIGEADSSETLQPPV